jgi:hypothetical protein
LTRPPDARRDFIFKFALEIPGTLLIRSPGAEANDPDAVHLTEDGKRILSGSSMAGALRAHAGRLLNTLAALERTPDVSLGALFGPSPQELREKKMSPQASRVVVDEVIVEGGKSHVQARVKIDRFTGGAFDGALFDEAPSVGGRVTFQVRVIDPPEPEAHRREAEIGLILLVARDLTAGLVPVGGGAAVGRGVLQGDVTLRDRSEKTWDLMNAADRSELEARFLKALIGERRPS